VPRHRAGRHPEGGPGAEHLHLLDEFALRMMGDVQEWFIQNDVRNFYSVSVSGYHIAEAGANPISPARVHAGERVHVRRVLPNRAARRGRVRAEPELLLQQRARRRVHGDRPGGASDLGVAMRDRYGADRSAARSSSTTSRRPAGRCTRARSRSTTSGRRLQALSRSATTATRCTRTPTTRRSPRRPRSRCAGRWRSS
jgi:hypothetical protein